MDKEISELKEKLNDTEKRMLRIEWVVGVFATVIFIGALTLATSQIMPFFWSVVIGAAGVILFVIGIYCCLKIEQTAGFYECQKCHHKYVPAYKSVLWGMHNGRTRYLKCPKCGERSWQKKVLS